MGFANTVIGNKASIIVKYSNGYFNIATGYGCYLGQTQQDVSNTGYRCGFLR